MEDVHEKDIEEAIIRESLLIHRSRNLAMMFLMSLAIAISLAIMIFGVTRVAIGVMIGLVVVIFSIANIISEAISSRNIRRGIRRHEELLMKEGTYKWHFNSIKNMILKAIDESKRIANSTRPQVIELEGMVFRSNIKRGLNKLVIDLYRVV